jgi:hypothetical protein
MVQFRQRQRVTHKLSLVQKLAARCFLPPKRLVQGDIVILRPLLRLARIASVALSIYLCLRSWEAPVKEYFNLVQSFVLAVR